MGASNSTESFHWSETVERLEELAGSHVFELDSSGRAFQSEDLRIALPLVFPLPIHGLESESAAELAARLAQKAGEDEPESNRELRRYLSDLPKAPGLQCLIVLQAGAAALGIFEGGEALATKALKRYVVRGKGRAQPAFLKTKGKSRYGSRLRLQNARQLIEDINGKLTEFFGEFGEPELIFASAPTRLWPDLFRAKTKPPFDRESPIVRVPLDLPVPTTEVMLRSYKSLCYGRIEALEGE